jgi:hypothetical protein
MGKVMSPEEITRALRQQRYERVSRRDREKRWFVCCYVVEGCAGNDLPLDTALAEALKAWDAIEARLQGGGDERP